MRQPAVDVAQHATGQHGVEELRPVVRRRRRAERHVDAVRARHEPPALGAAHGGPGHQSQRDRCRPRSDGSQARHERSGTQLRRQHTQHRQPARDPRRRPPPSGHPPSCPALRRYVGLGSRRLADRGARRPGSLVEEGRQARHETPRRGRRRPSPGFETGASAPSSTSGCPLVEEGRQARHETPQEAHGPSPGSETGASAPSSTSERRSLVEEGRQARHETPRQAHVRHRVSRQALARLPQPASAPSPLVERAVRPVTKPREQAHRPSPGFETGASAPSSTSGFSLVEEGRQARHETPQHSSETPCGEGVPSRFRLSVAAAWIESHERGTRRSSSRSRTSTPAGVLEAAAEAEQAERRAAVMKLRLAHQWAVLNPATPDTGVDTPGGPALDVLTRDESLGGDGTPAVAAFTPETFALKLGISPAAGARLIGDALDLRHRLPLLWKRVRRLQVPAWQARRVAQQTHALPLVGARWVDQRLAARTDGSLGPVITDRLVALAIAKYDPEEQEQREADAQAASDVKISHPDPTLYSGTSRPDRHRRHPDPPSLLRPGLRHRPPALARRRHRPLGCPQDQSHRPDHRHGLRSGRPRRPLRPRHSREQGVRQDQAPRPRRRRGSRRRRRGRRRVRGRHRRTPRRGHHGQAAPVGRPLPGRIPTRPEHGPPRRRRPTRPTRMDARARRAPRRPLRLPPLHRPRQELRQGPHRPPTSRSRTADHPDRPTPTPSPACAADTTAPKPHASGATPARPKATTSGTAPTAPPTSSPTPAPTASDRERSEGLLGEGAATWDSRHRAAAHGPRLAGGHDHLSAQSLLGRSRRPFGHRLHAHDPIGRLPLQAFSHAARAREVSIKIGADLAVSEPLNPDGLGGREQDAAKAHGSECLGDQVGIDDARGLDVDASRVALDCEHSCHGAHGVDRHSLAVLVVGGGRSRTAGGWNRPGVGCSDTGGPARRKQQCRRRPRMPTARPGSEWAARCPGWLSGPAGSPRRLVSPREPGASRAAPRGGI